VVGSEAGKEAEEVEMAREAQEMVESEVEVVEADCLKIQRVFPK
jgi:hypothetical protein